jgi:3',5'-cyclic-AMP phosphodiesterase
MTRIAHLSDIHLNGGRERYGRLSSALSRADSEWGARYLVLTGDLTADGHPCQFAELARALETSWPHGGTIVPGNHDVGDFGRMHGTYLGRFASQGPVELGDAVVLGLDTRYPARVPLFGALGRVGHRQMGLLRLLAASGTSERAQHVLVAMHHGPQKSGLGYFDGLTDRKHVLRILHGAPHMSILCGHDHRALDLGQVHAAPSVATAVGDPLRIYDVGQGGLSSVYVAPGPGEYLARARLPARSLP